MKLLFIINHPAQAHQFRYLIQHYQKKNDEVRVLLVDKDNASTLLDAWKVSYWKLWHTSGTGVFDKIGIFFMTTLKMFWSLLTFQPQVIISRASPMMIAANMVFQKPFLIFEDNETAKVPLKVSNLCASLIVTPKSFPYTIGPRHQKIDFNKELFYLHPRYREKISLDKKFLETDGTPLIFIRFIAWQAYHDFGHKGLSIEEKIGLVHYLDQYGTVKISSEKELPKELEQYRIQVPFSQVHGYLEQCSLFVGESPTMAVEAAVLGVHGVFISSIACATTDELEESYGLVTNVTDSISLETIKAKIGPIMEDIAHLKKHAVEKRDQLIETKVDPNAFFIEKIEEYRTDESAS